VAAADRASGHARVLALGSGTALSLAALSAGLVTARAPAGAGGHDAAVRNDAIVTASAAAANSGVVGRLGTVATGGASSRARPDQRARNEQVVGGGRSCPGGPRLQSARVRNALTADSRADSNNSGDVEGPGGISTGDTVSDVLVEQDAASRQRIEDPGPCDRMRHRQRSRVRNTATVVAHADASNAADAGERVTLSTPRAVAGVLVSQRSGIRQLVGRRPHCPAAGCRQSGATANVAQVRSYAGRRRGGEGTVAPSATAGRPHGPGPNVATIEQRGLTNTAAVQQSAERVDQSGAHNYVRTVSRQTLVFEGERLVRAHASVRTIAHTSATLPAGVEPRFERAGTVHTHCSVLVSGARRTSPSCALARQGDRVRVRQHRTRNVVAVQQAAHRIRQRGISNVAVSIVVQRIVFRPVRGARMPCRRRARSSVGLQHARQAIRQLGRRSTARTVVRRRLSGCGDPVRLRAPGAARRLRP
jgi:hypothetical protein